MIKNHKYELEYEEYNFLFYSALLSLATIVIIKSNTGKHIMFTDYDDKGPKYYYDLFRFKSIPDVGTII